MGRRVHTGEGVHGMYERERARRLGTSTSVAVSSVGPASRSRRRGCRHRTLTLTAPPGPPSGRASACAPSTALPSASGVRDTSTRPNRPVSPVSPVAPAAPAPDKPATHTKTIKAQLKGMSAASPQALRFAHTTHTALACPYNTHRPGSSIRQMLQPYNTHRPGSPIQHETHLARPRPRLPLRANPTPTAAVANA